MKDEIMRPSRCIPCSTNNIPKCCLLFLITPLFLVYFTVIFVVRAGEKTSMWRPHPLLYTATSTVYVTDTWLYRRLFLAFKIWTFGVSVTCGSCWIFWMCVDIPKIYKETSPFPSLSLAHTHTHTTPSPTRKYNLLCHFYTCWHPCAILLAMYTLILRCGWHGRCWFGGRWA